MGKLIRQQILTHAYFHRVLHGNFHSMSLLITSIHAYMRMYPKITGDVPMLGCANVYHNKIANGYKVNYANKISLRLIHSFGSNVFGEHEAARSLTPVFSPALVSQLHFVHAII